MMAMSFADKPCAGAEAEFPLSVEFPLACPLGPVQLPFPVPFQIPYQLPGPLLVVLIATVFGLHNQR